MHPDAEVVLPDSSTPEVHLCLALLSGRTAEFREHLSSTLAAAGED
jgi:hypothetical protein